IYRYHDVLWRPASWFVAHRLAPAWHDDLLEQVTENRLLTADGPRLPLLDQRLPVGRVVARHEVPREHLAPHVCDPVLHVDHAPVELSQGGLSSRRHRRSGAYGLPSPLLRLLAESGHLVDKRDEFRFILLGRLQHGTEQHP